LVIRRSNDHLAAAGESYLEHFSFASTVGLMAIAAGLACIIHAIVPALCTRTASRTIASLGRLLERREMLDEIAEEASEAIAFAGLLVLAAVVAAPLWLSDVPSVLQWAYTAMAFAFPATLLLTNGELAVQDAD
jgi:hypothetical protein